MTGDAALAIRVEGLAKRYGQVQALKDLSLDVRAGEIVGFLGLNGAGKTTTIRILLDLVRPTAGRAFVFGLDCRTQGLDARARIGYLPGEMTFYGDMTGAATLDLLCRLSGRRVEATLQRQLLDRFELSSRDLRKRLREYSTGMKRKLGIVQAFQADPPLLILDEPTEGLDPLMQVALYELLTYTRRRGKTVFMSSHVLHEVERVCDRIGLIRQGELVLSATVDEVRRLAARQVRVWFDEDTMAPHVWPEGCEVIEATPRMWSLRVHGALGPIVAILATLRVRDLEIREAHLEDVVRSYYRDRVPS